MLLHLLRCGEKISITLYVVLSGFGDEESVPTRTALWWERLAKGNPADQVQYRLAQRVQRREARCGNFIQAQQAKPAGEYYQPDAHHAPTRGGE